MARKIKDGVRVISAQSRDTHPDLEETKLERVTRIELALSAPALGNIAVHNGGMGSATWFIGHGSGRWAAKAVPAEAGSQFRANRT